MTSKTAESAVLKPDICVIGGGSGGLTVAAAAASFGISVVLIEKGKMGGDCLNYGCVPSKALIAAAKHAEAIREAPHFGISAGEPEIDFAKVNAHVHEVIGAIAPNDSVERFRALGVSVIQAEARFTDARTVVAGDQTIRARRFVLATGSKPRVPDIPGLSDVDYLTNETLFSLTTRPEHLIVIGGGPIGVEMAQAHRRLGCAVTILEMGTLLGKEDPELARIVVRRLEADGIAVHENIEILRASQGGDGTVSIAYRLDDEESTITASHLLVAVGRAAQVDNLGLKEAGITFDQRGIKVGSGLKTSNSRVFAIGDAVAGGLQFTHVANYHAGLVLQQILFRVPAKENRSVIPRVTFTDPELAQIGLTEDEARKAGHTITIQRWPYAQNDRAEAERRTGGEIKIVAGRRGLILGVGIVGHGAGEMINLYALALSKKMTLNDLRGFIAPYPTMSEIGKRAAISYYAPMTRKPFVRKLLAFLRRFG